MKVYRCIFDDKSKIEAIAFVKHPAILKEALTIQKMYLDKKLNFILNENRLISPLLIPNQYIYRFDDKTKEDYYLYYSEADVIATANYLINNINNIKFNIEHNSKQLLKDIEFIGVGLVDDIIEMNFYDMPKNSLFVQLMINNDDVMNKINSGEFRGLSIEGMLSLIEDNEAFAELEEQALIEKYNKLLDANKNYRI